MRGFNATETIQYINFRGTLPEIAEHFEINYSTLLKRLRRGMSLEEALQDQRIVNQYSVCEYIDTLPDSYT